MELFEIEKVSAIKSLKSADHILTMTFPLIKDPKLLLAVLQNVCKSFDHGANAVLQYEYMYKRISRVPEELNLKIKYLNSNRLKIEKSLLHTYVELKQLNEGYKKSPVTFSRQNKFIICANDYKTMELTPDLLKNYISKAKVFISHVNIITPLKWKHA